jgi:hypothetical protein
MPPGSPPHSAVPYAFKAYALKDAERRGFATLLWTDSCIVPGARPLAELWDKIEREGIWLARNGYRNDEWTADSAYHQLFPGFFDNKRTADLAANIELARKVNHGIEHVVATTFGLNLNHPTGRAFLDEYFRLASETKAFCGPWENAPPLEQRLLRTPDTPRRSHCGPASTRGHRHDQTCASVIAWRLGVQITDCPEWFSYRGGERADTCLVADGQY